MSCAGWAWRGGLLRTGSLGRSLLTRGLLGRTGRSLRRGRCPLGLHRSAFFLAAPEMGETAQKAHRTAVLVLGLLVAACLHLALGHDREVLDPRHAAGGRSLGRRRDERLLRMMVMRVGRGRHHVELVIEFGLVIAETGLRLLQRGDGDARITGDRRRGIGLHRLTDRLLRRGSGRTQLGRRLRRAAGRLNGSLGGRLHASG